jgi:hypothetical protein
MPALEFNLTDARKAMGAGDKAISDLILRTESAWSASLDISRANDMLKFALAHGAGTPPHELDPEVQAANSEHVQSGFLAAIILYCRGTGTSSDERRVFQFPGAPTHPLYEHSERVRDLRNKALGHWGAGGMGANIPWNRHALILSVDEFGMGHIDYNANMVVVTGQAVKDLQVLVPAAQAWIEKLKDELTSQLLDKIETASDAQREIISITPYKTSQVFGMNGGAVGEFSVEDGRTKFITRGYD